MPAGKGVERARCASRGSTYRGRRRPARRAFRLPGLRRAGDPAPRAQGSGAFRAPAQRRLHGPHGQTRGHLQAKRLLLDALRARGLRAEAEFATEQVAWDRRADVMVWSPGSRLPVAIEFQHSTIGIPEIEMRAQTYARAGIAQLWVPFLRPDALERAEPSERGTRIVERYPIRLHELWMYAWRPSAHSGCSTLKRKPSGTRGSVTTV